MIEFLITVCIINFVCFISMPYVTLIKSTNGKFDIELPSIISNVSQVGLVDFSFDSKKIDYLKVPNSDLYAHFEYDPSLDELTRYSNISMAQIDLFLEVEKNNAINSNL